MTKTEYIACRTTLERRRKLELMAIGEGTSISGVINRLIDLAPVSSIEIVRQGLTLRGQQNAQHVNAVPSP